MATESADLRHRAASVSSGAQRRGRRAAQPLLAVLQDTVDDEPSGVDRSSHGLHLGGVHNDRPVPVQQRPTAVLHCSVPVVAVGIRTVLAAAGWSVEHAPLEDEPVEHEPVGPEPVGHDPVGPGSGPSGVSRIDVVFVERTGRLDGVRAIRGRRPTARVVVITDVERLDVAVEALDAGATSVISWDSDPRVVVLAVELAAHDVSTFGRGALDRFREHDRARPAITDTERSWLVHLDRGITISELATVAGYSERSLYRLLSRLYQRLGVENRHEAISVARRRNLL